MLGTGNAIGQTVLYAARGNALPLDNLASSLFAAFSTRLLLSTALSNPCIRVRRSSDNAQQDIGFAGRWLNVAALQSFIGAASGYLVTWYDQSGNGRHITNSTAATQPRIINAGTLDAAPNTRPAVFFDVASQLVSSSITWPAGPLQITTVASAAIGNRDLFSMGLTGLAGIYVNLVRGSSGQDWQLGDAIACGNGFNTGRAPRVVSLNANAADGTLHQNTIQLTSLEASWRRDGSNTARRVQMATDVPALTGAMTLGAVSPNGLSGLCPEFVMLRRADTAVLALEANQRSTWGTP